MDTRTRTARAATGVIGLSALVIATACTTARDSNFVPQAPASAATGQASLPVVVSCEPTQRTIVRPTVVNGVAMSQVECVAGEVAAQPAVASVQPPGFTQPAALPAPQGFTATPVSYRTSSPAAPAPRVADLDDAQVVPVAAPRTAARPVQARQVVYDEPRPQSRSVKKSAIVIGSSAGVGAGVGAAVGGKKGALIGAAIGGGSAAIWEQITRRRD
jgi:hypothetical protein